jgi:hypothetical protein
MGAENRADVGEVSPPIASGVNPEAIREQLQLVLASDPFKHSKRYQRFLQYVVERTLDGHAAELKERTVGVDVFGRDAHYDTAADPVVRITAGEVRKRIAQYYDHSRESNALRITLPSGSYIPEFRFLARSEDQHNPTIAPQIVPPGPQSTSLPGPKPWHRVNSIYWLAAIAAAFIAGAYLPRFSAAPSSAMDRFWRPLCSAGGSVLVSVGEPNVSSKGGVESESRALASIPSTSRESNALPTLEDVLVNNTVSWADAIAAARIASLVRSKGCTFQIKRSESTFLPDLKSAPAVLVGGFNNKWIMRLLSQQRFSYVTEPAALVIKDSRDPGRMRWQVDVRQPPSQFHQDFGIVARFWDPTAERWIVVVSGIAAYGTLAASEFLTNPRYEELIQERAPAHWEEMNMEIVFSTAIIDGNTGPPHVVATQFW